MLTGLMVAGCNAENATTSATGADSGLSITSPSENGNVQVPFTVKLASDVPLAAPDTGEHHAHIFFDGDDSHYILAYGDSIRINKLPPGVGPGEHVLDVSLRNADHSAAGVETQVDITIGMPAGTQTGGSGSSDDGPGYSY
ncbi:MAG: hypothetical protein ACRDO0_19880 [Nocardioidaceae bacterium]